MRALAWHRLGASCSAAALPSRSPRLAAAPALTGGACPSLCPCRTAGGGAAFGAAAPRAGNRQLPLWAATRAASSAAAAGDGAAAAELRPPFKLVLYTKDDCPLCDGLKEKLAAVLERAAFVPSPLSGVPLEARNIAARPEWAAAHAMSVPVLARAELGGGGERVLPRAPPRCTADALEKHLAKALAALG